MMPRMKERGGMAVLVDAFVFLIACAVVSTALMSSLPASKSDGDNIEEYLERAHRVLLRSSFHDIEGDGQGATPTVQETVHMLLHAYEEEGIGPQIDRLEIFIESMMEGLLPSFLKYHWSARCGDRAISAGWGPGDHCGDRYVSFLSIHSPLLGDEVVVQLIAWC